MAEKSYEQGLVEGRLSGVEKLLEDHHDRLNSHSMRLSRLEKVAYAVIGAFAILQAVPLVQSALSGG